MVRKYSEPLEEHGNLLISVPGGNDGPSGVLVCSENYITYKNFGDQPDIRMPIPRRKVGYPLVFSFMNIHVPLLYIQYIYIFFPFLFPLWCLVFGHPKLLTVS